MVAKGQKTPESMVRFAVNQRPSVSDQDEKGWRMGRAWDQSCWPRDLENKAEND